MVLVVVPSVTTLTPYVLRYTGNLQRQGDITRDTAKSLRHQLYPFAASFGQRPVDQLGKRAVERWLEETTHLRPSTRAARLCTLRRFAGWLIDEGVISKDFTRGVRKIRRPRREPRDVQLDHFVACLRSCQTTRHAVVIWLAYGLGLRCVEISRLTIDDWDTTSNELHVVGKALHERTVPVPSVVRAVLMSYLRERGATSGAFVHNETRPGDHLTASCVSSMVSRICDRTGMKIKPYDGFSAHGLRSGAASDLLDACGGDLRVVMEFLGHANLATTSIYTRRAGRARMRAALEQRRWTHDDNEAA